jgi:hypothetical protein
LASRSWGSSCQLSGDVSPFSMFSLGLKGSRAQDVAHCHFFSLFFSGLEGAWCPPPPIHISY